MSRMQEGLGLVRDMWMETEMSGAGPNYVFGEIKPTMRTVRPQGPPLSLAVADADDAATAARLGVGAHVQYDGGGWQRLLEAYGEGETSVELDHSAATAEELRRLADAGVDQVDVRIRSLGDEPIEVHSRVEQLVERTQSVFSSANP